MIVGIDPGVCTGLAMWTGHEFTAVTSMDAVDALLRVQSLKNFGSLERVVFEDARLRGGRRSGKVKLTPEEIARLQGAGSIKRECQIWADWLDRLGVPYKAVAPKAKGPKVDAERFAKLTGWTGRTNEHARDAAMLVWRANAT